MSVDITEFVEINPENVDAVFKAANGTDFLMIKQVDDNDADDKGGKPDDDEDDDAAKSEFCGDPGCVICIDRASKGKLSMEQRRQIPKSDFALPEKAPGSGSYPIKDRKHARLALQMRGHASPEDQARIKRAVAAKYPDIGKGKKKGKKASNQDMPGQSTQEHEGTPSPSSLMGQTNTNQRHQAINRDVFPKHGAPSIPDGGRPPEEGHGGGHTAPDKELHIDEAKAQTNARVSAETSRGNASKEVADMKGDPMPKARNEGAEASGPAQEQTEHNARRSAPADHIRDQMTRQNEQAQKAFKFKVKKGGKKKRKKNAPLEISGAMKQLAPQGVLSEALASKEFDDMNGAELAEVFTAALDARDARKAAERSERKAKKKAKAEKKARKQAKRTDGGKTEEAAQDAAKSVSPERFVDGLADVVASAMKQGLEPLVSRVKNLEDQPARPRLAINNGADPKAVLRDQKTPGGAHPMDILKPLEDAFKSAVNPTDVVTLPDGRKMTKEKLGNELTLARFVIDERLRNGQPVSQADAAIASAAR